MIHFTASMGIINKIATRKTLGIIVFLECFILIGILILVYINIKLSEKTPYDRELEKSSISLDWSSYRDENQGIYFEYPANLTKMGLQITARGKLDGCNKGMTNVILGVVLTSIHICSDPTDQRIRAILEDPRYDKRNVIVNGKEYTVLTIKDILYETSPEHFGRYWISKDHFLYIQVFNNNEASLKTPITTIFLRMISSLENI